MASRWDTPPKKRWGRLDSDNRLVEFTFINPVGRFHPDIRWIEVELDTPYGTKITLFGDEIPEDPESIIGVTDPHVLWLESQARMKEEQERLETAKEPEPSEFTANFNVD